MDVVIGKNGTDILLIAETEFEKSFCDLYDKTSFEATLKTGASPADVVGLKLKVVKKDEKDTSTNT